MQNYGLMERLPWPQDEIADSNSSQVTGYTPLSSLDVSVIGDRVDIDELWYKYGEATFEEMFDDEVTIDTEHGNVTEHTQAKSCCKLANLMVEPDQGVDVTVRK